MRVGMLIVFVFARVWVSGARTCTACGTHARIVYAAAAAAATTTIIIVINIANVHTRVHTK